MVALWQATDVIVAVNDIGPPISNARLRVFSSDGVTNRGDVALSFANDVRAHHLRFFWPYCYFGTIGSGAETGRLYRSDGENAPEVVINDGGDNWRALDVDENGFVYYGTQSGAASGQTRFVKLNADLSVNTSWSYDSDTYGVPSWMRVSRDGSRIFFLQDLATGPGADLEISTNHALQVFDTTAGTIGTAIDFLDALNGVMSSTGDSTDRLDEIGLDWEGRFHFATEDHTLSGECLVTTAGDGSLVTGFTGIGSAASAGGNIWAGANATPSGDTVYWVNAGAGSGFDYGIIGVDPTDGSTPYHWAWSGDATTGATGIAVAANPGATTPPCTAYPFQARCGDVLDALTTATCNVIECWRSGSRIGRLVFASGLLADRSNIGIGMALDRDGNLYAPYYQISSGTGGSELRTVRKFGNGAKFFSGEGSTWWTPPDSSEYPVVVSADASNRLYVLVVGGGTTFDNSTYLRLYKLNTSASTLATFDLGIPTAGSSNAHGISGAAVSRDGAKYLYGFFNAAPVIAAYDLANDVQLADFTSEADFSALFPGGIRFRSNGEVLVANGLGVGSSILRKYASDASSVSDYPAAATSFAVDVDIDQDAGYAYVLDFETRIFRVQLSDTVSNATVWADLSGEDTVSNFFPLAVMCGGSMPTAAATSRVWGIVIA